MLQWDLFSYLDYFLDGASLIDRHGQIQYCNQAFADMVGLSQKRLHHKNIKQVLQFDESSWQKVGQFSLIQEPTQYYRFPFNNNQFEHELGICFLPVQNQPDYLLLLCRDFSLEKLLQQKYQSTLKQKEEIFRAHQRKLFESLFLSSLVDVAGSATGPEEILEKFLPKTIEIFEFQGIATFLLNNEEKLELKGHAKKDFVSLQVLRLLIQDYRNHVETCMQKNQPIQIQNSIYNMVLIPISRNEKVLGLTVCLKDVKEIITEDEVQMVEAMGNHIALNVESIKLREDVYKDALTGIFNKRYFNQKIDQEILQSQNKATPVSLIMTDIDYFKKVNDTFGHQTGDLILKEVARVVQNMVREKDIVCRYGGEEFAIILPDTTTDGAMVIAERIRQAVEKHTPDPQRPFLKVTLSLGIASAPLHSLQREHLVEFADKALYDCKRAGRNQSQIYDPNKIQQAA